MATKDDAAPLELPAGWIRGDTLGPITTTVTGRSVEGATARLTFRRGTTAGEIVQCCSSDPDLTVGEGASLISLDAEANTATVAPWEPNTADRLVYDFELRWPDGNPRVATLHAGKWQPVDDSSK